MYLKKNNTETKTKSLFLITKGLNISKNPFVVMKDSLNTLLFYKKYSIDNVRKTVVVFMFASASFAQNGVADLVVNDGIFTISSKAIMSTTYGFSNEENGVVRNEGQAYYYNNFKNNNLYYYEDSSNNPTTFFVGEEGIQKISGDKMTEFYNVVFEHPTIRVSGELAAPFELQNEVLVKGKADFKEGVVKIDSLSGMLSFAKGASVSNVSDKSYAEGTVEKIGNDEFVFPSGDKGLYRAAHISAPEKEKEAYTSKYTLDDKEFFKKNNVKSGVLNTLNDREYWKLEKVSKNNQGSVLLTLSWDERTTPEDLLLSPEKDLHIVRWDSNLKLWVDEGGVVDLQNKTVTTSATVKGYGIFTLATVKTDWILEDDVVIYNLVTPDGDGKNDYFLVDNINRYPNNKVEIYNRWGVKVYDTRNYDSNGDGSINVFKGVSEGHVTVNSNSKLPTGTYYYIVTYDYKGSQGSRTIKKSGYLHLENH